MTAAERMIQVPVYKNGARVAPSVLTTPCEVVLATKNRMFQPQTIKIEYDEDGLHFLTNWGMCSIRKEDLIEKSDSILPPMHD